MNKKRLVVKVAISCVLAVVFVFNIVFLVDDFGVATRSWEVVSHFSALIEESNEQTPDIYVEFVNQYKKIAHDRIQRIIIGFFTSLILAAGVAYIWLEKRFPLKTPAQLEEERQERVRRQKAKQGRAITAKKTKLQKQLDDLEKDGD